MVGWHHRLNGHEFEQTLGDSEGQGSMACCSSWGCKESDMTQRLNDKATTPAVSPGAFVAFSLLYWMRELWSDLYLGFSPAPPPCEY